MGIEQALVGCPADLVLPAEWLNARRCGPGRHRRISFGGHRYLLSCAAMNASDPTARGHLLSIVPDNDTLENPTP
jgi:hypothetical protein